MPSNHQSDSSFSCLARKKKGGLRRRGNGDSDVDGGVVVDHHPPSWSLITSLPQSPSPICTYHPSHSHTPTTSTTTYLDNGATHNHFSTQTITNQGLKSQKFGNNNYCSNCFSDIDEWLEHANKFCKSFNHHTTETVVVNDSGVNGGVSLEEEDMRISAVCNHFQRAPEDELYNIILPSVREESPLHHAQTHLTSCIRYGGPPYKSRLIMSTKHKPYDQLLNHITMKKIEADREARNKAKHVQLMHRLRRKEEAINDWEVQKTKKAMDHMDKIQNELERKQLMASSRTQKKICKVREKAEKQKLNLRRSTMKKFQQLQISETLSLTDASWNSG